MSLQEPPYTSHHDKSIDRRGNERQRDQNAEQKDDLCIGLLVEGGPLERRLGRVHQEL